MTQVKVHFKAITDVYAFVGIVSKYTFDVDMCSGRYVIDAKSIMTFFPTFSSTSTATTQTSCLRTSTHIS